MGHSDAAGSFRDRPLVHAWGLVALVLLVGAAFSLAAFFAIQARERELVELAFRHKAQMQLAAIRIAIERGIDAVDDTGALFDASDATSREKFRQFAQHLLVSNPALQGLGWIPVVPEVERAAWEAAARKAIPGYRFVEFDADGKLVPAASHARHYPIYYVEGRSSQHGLAGLDHAGDATRMEALNRSRDSGRVMATGRTTALGDKVLGNGSIAFFRPVYRAGAPTGSVEQRRDALVGFTSAVFIVGSLIGNVLNRLDEVDVAVTLYDSSAPVSQRFLAVWPADAAQQPLAPAGASEGRYSSTLDVGGREWKAVFAPRNGISGSATSLRAWGVLAGGLIISLLLAGYISSEQRRLRVVREQAITDPLTGLYNRRYLLELLPREFSRARRYGDAIAAVMLDIDHFKEVNDEHGHAAGDLVLRELGKLLKGSVRGSDIACRYGGEEFVVVLPEASLEDVKRRAEALQIAAREMRLEYRGRPIHPVSISLGVAMFPECGDDPETLLRCADYAMYEAKKAGRDRVMAYVPPSGHERAPDQERRAEAREASLAP